MHPDIARTRAKVAAGETLDPAEAKLAEYIASILAAAPPFTDEQRATITRLLMPR